MRGDITMEHIRPAKYNFFDTVVFTKNDMTWKFEVTPHGLKHLAGDLTSLKVLTPNLCAPYSTSDIDKIFITLNPEYALLKEIAEKLTTLYAQKTRYEELIAVM